jgi:hypothetical protein
LPSLRTVRTYLLACFLSYGAFYYFYLAKALYPGIKLGLTKDWTGLFETYPIKALILAILLLGMFKLEEDLDSID